MYANFILFAVPSVSVVFPHSMLHKHNPHTLAHTLHLLQTCTDEPHLNHEKKIATRAHRAGGTHARHLGGVRPRPDARRPRRVASAPVTLRETVAAIRNNTCGRVIGGCGGMGMVITPPIPIPYTLLSCVGGVANVLGGIVNVGEWGETSRRLG